MLNCLRPIGKELLVFWGRWFFMAASEGDAYLERTSELL